MIHRLFAQEVTYHIYLGIGIPNLLPNNLARQQYRYTSVPIINKNGYREYFNGFVSKVEDKYVEDANDDEGDVANGDDYVFCTEGNCIVDPDPDDPYYFGLPDPEQYPLILGMDPDPDPSIINKIARKTLIPTVL